MIPIACTNTTRFLVTGTSLTDPANAVGRWAGRPGSLIDQIRAKNVAFAPAQSNAYVPSRLGQSAPASYSPLVSTGRRQVVMQYGVGGRVVAGLASDLAASIYVWQPDVIIIEICANDFGVTSVTPGGAFQTSYNTVLDGIGTNLPKAKVLCLSVTVHDERTLAGPHLNDNADTWAGNTRIQESCAARNSYCTYVDVITPAMNYCVANNTPFPGGSTPRYLTPDNLHQSNAGAVIMANAVMAQLTFS